MTAPVLIVMLMAAAPCAPAGRGDEIRVTTSVKPATATVGDRISLEIVFTTPPAMRLDPVISATAQEEWDILGVKGEQGRSLPDGSIEQKFTVVLVPWSATLTATPSFAFNAVTPPGRVQSIRVNPTPVKMESVLAKAKDAGDLRPLKGVIGYRSWWPLYLALAAVVLVAAGIWLRRLIKKRRAAARGELPEVPARPPEETARDALDALLSSKLLEEGHVKLFYSGLSDIFRRYVEGRLAIPALDRTTAELLPELRRRDEMRPLFSEIRLFLDGCDLVKFAKYLPDPADIAADVGRVRRFVDSTSPPLAEAGASR